MDISCLKEAGLTDGEVKVYLALLELGPSTTGPIIEKSKIARSIAYQILNNLLDKGLASYIIKEKTKHYQAAQPDKILEYIEERKNKLLENKKKVEELLPELLLKKSSTKESEATIYYGLKGLRTAHEHIYEKLKSGEEYYYLGVPAYQPDEQHLYWQRDHVRRVKSGIKARLLFNKGTDLKVVENRNSFEGAEARFMPTSIVTPAMFLIYKDTVLISIQTGARISVEIINQEIADSFKAYFLEFWNESKPFKT